MRKISNLNDILKKFFFSKKQKKRGFIFIFIFTGVRFKIIRKFYEVRFDMGAPAKCHRIKSEQELRIAQSPKTSIGLSVTTSWTKVQRTQIGPKCEVASCSLFQAQNVRLHRGPKCKVASCTLFQAQNVRVYQGIWYVCFNKSFLVFLEIHVGKKMCKNTCYIV